ncbi:MAG TPA: hypothetical protein VHU44_16860 [Acidobacteriaceae bacterium]|nr:hypothetical protein [Acidobacteriaceae bacterium]
MGVRFLVSRLPVFAAAGVLVAYLALASHVLGSLPAAWTSLRVPAGTFVFADTFIVTNSIDCLLAGKDPYREISCDPYNRLYNYPPAWLLLRHADVTSRSTVALGTGMAILMFCALLVVFSTEGWVSGLIVFAAILSFPMFFALERGNIDLIVFSTMVFGLGWAQYLRERQRRLSRCALIVLLTILKIYPVAMVTVLTRGRRGWLRAGVVALVSVAALVATAGSRLHEIKANTPQDTWVSFGSFDVVEFVHLRFFPMATGPIVGHKHWIGSVAALGLGALAAWYGAANRPRLSTYLPAIDIDTGIGAIAAAGLSVYCMVFLLGANYDYRLIFLLAPLGFLLRGTPRAPVIRPLPVAMLLLSYLMTYHLNSAALHEAFEPVVFLTMCAWLGLS